MGAATPGIGRLRRFTRDNGLVLACLGLFGIFMVGMVVSGWHVYNQDQTEHGGVSVTMLQYLRTGDFIEATFENWESEFLQMAMYVVLTAFLYQKGSAESKPLPEDAEAPQDADPRARHNRLRGPCVICHRYGATWIATSMGPPWRVIEDALRGWVGQVRVGVVGGRRGPR